MSANRTPKSYEPPRSARQHADQRSQSGNIVRAPKDQIERYTTPPSGRLFKGSSHDGGIPWKQKTGKVTDVHEPFWDVSRGTAKVAK